MTLYLLCDVKGTDVMSMIGFPQVELRYNDLIGEDLVSWIDAEYIILGYSSRSALRLNYPRGWSGAIDSLASGNTLVRICHR